MVRGARSRIRNKRWQCLTLGRRGRSSREIADREPRSPNSAEPRSVRRGAGESATARAHLRGGATLVQRGSLACPHRWPYGSLALVYGERVAAAHGLRVTYPERDLREGISDKI